MEPAYEFYEHTADMGIRVVAPTREELLKPAGEGLYAVIGRLVPAGPQEEVSFDLEADEPAVLLRDFLAEVLSLFEQERQIVVALNEVRFDDDRLRATGLKSPVDRDRSEYLREVKAVTYHDLRIREIPGGCEATFIVDI